MRVKTKTDVSEKNSPSGTAYTSGQELDLPDKEGKALVSGGFADELDDRGYLIDGEPSNPQPGSGTPTEPAEPAEEEGEEEDDLESHTVAELREMGGTGRTKAELIASLSED